MSKKNLVSALLAAAMVVGSVAAVAQPRPDDGHRPPPGAGHRPPPGHPGPGPGHRPPPPPGHGGPRPDPAPMRWNKGDHVPPVYRGRQYVVSDWRGHSLHRPPSGYQWISTGPDYFLIGIATGAVLESVLH